ncbi:hypothetical protein RDI58_010689 [Solanum bulbocastanum]|uniref:Reverse transcriptase zinc-binding domain-containing protein n=1 Tax=Solanum bulbocastanum TaxID=147425 RepID=A0AAN8YJR1_SOLBU
MQKWSLVEEKVLRQKSRACWIDSGDANSKYFHAQLKIRVPMECAFCSQEEETFTHLFFSCSYSYQAKQRNSIAEIVCCTFAMMAYYTWRDRNIKRFQNGRVHTTWT